MNRKIHIREILASWIKKYGDVAPREIRKNAASCSRVGNKRQAEELQRIAIAAELPAKVRILKAAEHDPPRGKALIHPPRP